MAVLYINLSDASAVERNLNQVQNNLKNMLSALNTAQRKVEGINKNDYYINAYRDRIAKEKSVIKKDIDTITGFLSSYKKFINFAKDRDKACASRITDSGYNYRKSTGLLKEEHKKILLGVLVIGGTAVLTFFCPAAAPVAIGALVGGAFGYATGGADGFLAGALGGAVGGALFAVAGPALGGLATSVFGEGAMATIATGVLTGALSGAGDGAVSGYLLGGKEGAIEGAENGALFGALFGGATELLGGITNKIAPKVKQALTDSDINLKSLSTNITEATNKIINCIKTKLESLFEYVRETFDLGDKIKFITRDGIDVDISKSEFTKEEVEHCLNGCFTGDTLVRTKEGLKRIDSIDEGNLVFSKNIETGEVTYKPVKYIYKKHTKDFINIKVEGNLIETTPNHLFMLNSGEWKSAENLESGDSIVDSEGKETSIDFVEKIGYNEAREIYNLNVDEFHTYFVSDLELLVHNDCSVDTPNKSNNGARYGEQKISDQLYEKLRKQTPTDEIRDMVNEGVDLPMDDFALPGLQITNTLEADHIVPMKKIASMEGFEKLSYEQQLSILNYKDNFIGLSKVANTSKGSKTYEEWELYKKGDIKVDPAFKERMVLLQKSLEEKLQSLIDNFLKK